MLQNIRIVLVETSHTGNMGSVARATKITGLTNLWLVSPLIKPDPRVIALAAGASDVVGNAHIVDTLDEALVGCSLVVGTSACPRTLPWPMLDPRECGLKSVAEVVNTPVTLAFGRERIGSTSEELQKCYYHAAIVVSPEYSSLNLTTAVQVIAYEACMAWLAIQENGKQARHKETPYPLVDDLERFYDHLEQILLATSFIRGNHPGQVTNKLRRLLTRARPGSQESNTLRGILVSIEQQNEGSKARGLSQINARTAPLLLRGEG